MSNKSSLPPPGRFSNAFGSYYNTRSEHEPHPFETRPILNGHPSDDDAGNSASHIERKELQVPRPNR